MKKMLNLFGVITVFGNGAGLVTSNNTNQQMNDNWENEDTLTLEQNKTLQIEPQNLWDNASEIAKINLTKLGIKNLNELKKYHAVSLPNFEIKINGDKANDFLLIIPTNDLKILLNKVNEITMDDKVIFKTFVDNEWYTGHTMNGGNDLDGCWCGRFLFKNILYFWN